MRASSPVRPFHYPSIGGRGEPVRGPNIPRSSPWSAPPAYRREDVIERTRRVRKWCFERGLASWMVNRSLRRYGEGLWSWF
jgi:hypothetical protein